jgi:hypothetical protein
MNISKNCLIRERIRLKGVLFQFFIFGVSLNFASLAIGASVLPNCSWFGKKDNCFGEEVLPNGRLYMGEFRNGKRHGIGTITFKDGFKYVGEFSDGLYEGKGELLIPPGWLYVGDFLRGRFHGNGKLTLPDGRTYTGTFKEDNFDGFGTLTFPDGRKFVGQFKNDQFDGEGAEYLANGEIGRAGSWNAGTFVEPDSLQSYALSNAHSVEKASAQQQVLAEAQAKALADARAQIAAQSKALAESQAMAEIQTLAREKAETQAKALAQEQEKAQVESKARAKADEQARTLAEAQARALAEAQELAHTEGLARAKAEANAKALADAQMLGLSESLRSAQIGPKLTSIALIIGNGNYSSFSKLPNPRNDASAIAQKLRSFGIEVDLVLDADRGSLVNALNRYQLKALGRDVNIFFYAGHGLQINGINYLIPTDMRADGLSVGYVKLNGVSVNDAMDYLPSKTRLVFLDACRDNPAARSLIASRGAGAVGLAPIDAPSGTLVSYATKEGTTAEDGNGQNSPFTTALLENLDANQDIGIVLRKVRRRVLALTSGQQEPWEYGSLTGDQLIVSTMSR